MKSSVDYSLLADSVLLLHVLFVCFVVFGLVAIFMGKKYSWSWVRNPWFRVLHLLAIGAVVIQTWFGILCPLTTLEMKLRLQAGEAVYSGSFIGHWLEMLLYYDAPGWVFTLCYTVFGIIVVFSWFWVRPRKFS